MEEQKNNLTEEQAGNPAEEQNAVPAEEPAAGFTEEDLGKLVMKSLDLQLTSLKKLLNIRYDEDFEIYSVSFDPGNRDLPFAAFPVNRREVVFSGILMNGGRLVDDYVARTVMPQLENEVAACFAGDSRDAAVRVDTECRDDVPAQEKDMPWPAFVKARGYSDLFLRIILLRNAFLPEQPEARMREIIRRLGIHVDLSAYIYTFDSEAAFNRCRTEVFGKPRVSNDDIEFYQPDSKSPIWIEREL